MNTVIYPEGSKFRAKVQDVVLRLGYYVRAIDRESFETDCPNEIIDEIARGINAGERIKEIIKYRVDPLVKGKLNQ